LFAPALLDAVHLARAEEAIEALDVAHLVRAKEALRHGEPSRGSAERLLLEAEFRAKC
jgi:hypothetical protein